MLFVILVIGVIGALVAASEPVSSWIVCLLALLIMVHIPPVKRHFLWWLGRFVTNNNTRLGTWWVLNIMSLMVIVGLVAQILITTDNDCTPSNNFPTQESRNRHVAKGGVLCEHHIWHKGISWETVGWSFLALLGSTVGATVYIPIALYDEYVVKREEIRKRHTQWSATRAAAGVAAPGPGPQTAQRAFLWSTLIALVGDALVELFGRR